VAVRVQRGGPDPEAERHVLDAIDDDETVELLRELIALDTQNPPGNEAIIARALAARLRSAASSIRLVEVAPGRENLEARFGRPGRGRLVINGHTDTMPAGIGWTSPPHEPTLAGDAIRGRGACDVKGGLAAAVEALLAVARAGVPLAGEVILDAVADEEAGGRGTARTIADGREADWAIVLEPTDLAVIPSGNGQVNFELVFAGVAAHGSTPEAGRNAIADAASFIRLVERAAQVFARAPHPRIGPASYNVGTIEGGVQTSIVPASCRLTLDRRILPGQSVEEAISDVDGMIEELRSGRPGAEVARRVLTAIPPIDQPDDLPVCSVLRTAVAEAAGGDVGLGGLRATSDAAQLVSAGIPSVVFGPGSITRSAHRPDEDVPLAELHAASRALALTIVRLVGIGS
jgi:acetylornithine deacetylase